MTPADGCIDSYRLNLFGFPGNPVAEPNLGLLDVRKALEWVRDNIRGFGATKRESRSLDNRQAQLWSTTFRTDGRQILSPPASASSAAWRVLSPRETPPVQLAHGSILRQDSGVAARKMMNKPCTSA